MSSIPKPSPLLGGHLPGAGELSIGGVIDWLERLFFAPGDWLLWSMASHTPHVAAFLDLSAADYGGPFSGVVSAIAWLAALVVVGAVYGAVRDFDRALTQRIRYLYDDARLRLRVAVRLFGLRLRRVRSLGTRRARKEPVLELSEEVEVSVEELKVLHVASKLKPGFALPVSEIAAAIGARKKDTQRLLARLKQLDFLADSMSGLDGERAFTLTAAGRAFLVFRQISAETGRRGFVRAGVGSRLR